MAISIKCPNGHDLKVKDEYAGKSGLCPHCHAKVQVPVPPPKPVARPSGKVSDDDVLAMLGPPRRVKVEAEEEEGGGPAFPPRKPPAAEESIHDAAANKSDSPASGISLLGASVLRREKLCPHCGNLTSQSFTHCPRCGTPLPASTAVSGKKPK
jgi:hypothetical protein